MNKYNNFFNNTLREVMLIEKNKKEICHQLLLEKNNHSRQKLIYNFLSYDLDKHEMLREASQVAIENNEAIVIKKIQLLYCWREENELLCKIRTEIERIKSFMSTINRAIDSPSSISFLERRFVQEINKYVIAQARLYNKIKQHS